MIVSNFFQQILKRTIVRKQRIINAQQIRNYLNETNDFNTTNARSYDLLVRKCFTDENQVCFIIHPYVKWGPRKILDTLPERQMSEAVSLINTLGTWRIQNQLIVPVENLDRNTVFGSGTTEKLRLQIRRDQNVTVVFINVKSLKNSQIMELERLFGVPVLDRYNIVMQILRQHATSKQAKLQVELAEIQYMSRRLKYLQANTHGNWDVFLQNREQKIRADIEKLRKQRVLLRSKRKELEYPIVAFIGYTNSGKTSLVKCLTDDKALIPKDVLFATLDVTVHAGLLSSKLQVLFIDTVGFISDIPTNLIECFVTTLEDALLADVIIHVQDVSNEDFFYQRKHMISVIESLYNKSETENIMNRIISVGNKSDIILENNRNLLDDNSILVSAKHLTGIDELKERIESLVLKTTQRRIIRIRVPTGGNEMRWLFKNATVIDQKEDVNDHNFHFMNVIIKESRIKQFHDYFVKNRNKNN